MNIHQLLTANQYLFEQVYLLFLILVAVIITLKVHRLYQLSFYRGLKYFRNAFFFFTLSFSLLFVKNWLGKLMGLYTPLGHPPLGFENATESLFSVLFLSFHYTIALATLFLVYSLIWKHCEKRGIKCLISGHQCGYIYVLHVVSLLIAVICFLFEKSHTLFITMLAVLFFAIVKVFSLHKKAEEQKKKTFLCYYAVVLLLFFIGWGINFFSEFDSFNAAYPYFWIYQELMTALIFAILLYGTIKVTTAKRRELS